MEVDATLCYIKEDRHRAALVSLHGHKTLISSAAIKVSVTARLPSGDGLGPPPSGKLPVSCRSAISAISPMPAGSTIPSNATLDATRSNSAPTRGRRKESLHVFADELAAAGLCSPPAIPRITTPSINGNAELGHIPIFRRRCVLPRPLHPRRPRCHPAWRPAHRRLSGALTAFPPTPGGTSWTAPASDPHATALAARNSTCSYARLPRMPYPRPLSKEIKPCSAWLDRLRLPRPRW